MRKWRSSPEDLEWRTRWSQRVGLKWILKEEGSFKHFGREHCGGSSKSRQDFEGQKGFNTGINVRRWSNYVKIPPRWRRPSSRAVDAAIQSGW